MTSTTGGRQPLWVFTGLGFGIFAIVVLSITVYRLSSRLSALQARVQAEDASLSERLALVTAATNQSLEELAQRSRQSTQGVEERARQSDASLAARLAQQQQTQQQVAGEVDQLKQASSDANSKLSKITADVSNVKGDVGGVRGDVADTQSQTEQNGMELKRVTGDLGVMGGVIATNAQELKTLRQMGEREYIEFDLKKGGSPQRVGKIQLALNRADPKRNRFTLDVLADDKHVEKRDRTINEPVQLYLSGYRQPCEIVVNEVKKDEVVGYFSVPKAAAASASR